MRRTLLLALAVLPLAGGAQAQNASSPRQRRPQRNAATVAPSGAGRIGPRQPSNMWTNPVDVVDYLAVRGPRPPAATPR